MPALGKSYLVFYNAAQTAGWALVIWKTVQALVETGDASKVYTYAGPAVRYCQGAAILEVLHAASGLVRGSPATALLQWAGRSNCLFAVLHCIPELWQTLAVPVLFMAWAISEVIRYPWYATSLLGGAPHALTWLRYTAFYALYPVGVVAEMWIIATALPTLASTGLHSISLPNAWNWAFSYHYFMVGILALYPLLWWQLYTFLIRQRSKKLKTL